jgi:hypothetical protein
MRALEAWTKVLRKKYGVVPRFTHSDKDMAEIGMCQTVWPEAKVQLCWWHIRKAVHTQLRGNLPTLPYDVGRACKEYTFIEKSFHPCGKSNPDDTELLPDETNTESTQHDTTAEGLNPNSLYIRIPNLQPSSTTAPPACVTPSCSVLPTVSLDLSDENHKGGARLTIKVPAHFQIVSEEKDKDEEAEKTT